MATVDNIRNSLIKKLLAVSDREFLKALDQLVATTTKETEVIQLTDEQHKLLMLSEDDIREGNTISQEAMNKRNREWLGAM
ncbi:hypothetical protein [Nonlabens ponticola]|uniref:Uncharacterized protein n=1 Tax=Nonlabens ponticola TaxID=2496866 RepID=A0A3S9MUH1_9FLAO|nr:hypothetical protein [Nonlabens ponticola]AZQ42825.1 hypothetical protein EJ995_00700 [Nonlabens ponticola]